MKPMISYEDFKKLDIRVGTITQVTVPEGSKKLLRCEVDFGGELGTRVVFSGIKEWYAPEDLEGKQAVYLVNLAPRQMMGEESEGMLLAAAPRDESGEPEAVLLVPEEKVEDGTEVI